MDVQRCLVAPAFQDRQFVRVDHALEQLELFTAGLFHHLCAARLVGLRQLRPFSRCRVDRYNESNRHIVSSVVLARESLWIVYPLSDNHKVLQLPRCTTKTVTIYSDDENEC